MRKGAEKLLRLKLFLNYFKKIFFCFIIFGYYLTIECGEKPIYLENLLRFSQKKNIFFQLDNIPENHIISSLQIFFTDLKNFQYEYNLFSRDKISDEGNSTGYTEIEKQVDLKLKGDSLAKDKKDSINKNNINSDKIIDLNNGLFPKLTGRSNLEFLSLSNSFSGVSLRGALPNQIKYYIDGVDISDHFYPVAFEQSKIFKSFYYSIPLFRESQMAQSSSINLGHISEIKINSDGTNPDKYSGAGGVINYYLKEASGPIKGGIAFLSSFKKLEYNGPDIYNDDYLYFAEKNKYLNNSDQFSKIKATHYTYEKGLYKIGKIPVLADIFISGKLGNLGVYFSSGLLENPDCRLPNQSYREIINQLKINYDFFPNFKVSAFGILNDKGKLFGWKNKEYVEMLKYFLQGVPQSDGINWIGNIKISHTLNNKLSYDLQLSNRNENLRKGFVDGNNDGIISLNEVGELLTFSDTSEINRYLDAPGMASKAFGSTLHSDPTWESDYTRISYISFRLGWPAFFYENYKSNIFSSNINLEYNLNQDHSINMGVQAKFHNLSMDKKISAIGLIDSKRPLYVEEWNLSPMEIGFYIQDKINIQDFSFNLGIRIDMWDAGAKEIDNFFDPWKLDSITWAGGKYLDIVSLRKSDNVDPVWKITPRFSFSHPISKFANIFFSISKNYQPPPFSLLFSCYNSLYSTLPPILRIKNEGYESLSYEAGSNLQINYWLKLYINTYFKEINNYYPVNYNFIIPNKKVNWIIFNSGSITSRGIETTLETDEIELCYFADILCRICYSYSSIKGSDFVFESIDKKDNPSDVITDFSGDGQKYSSEIPFQDYQYLKKTEKHLVGGASTLTNGFDREHRIRYFFQAIFPYEFSLLSTGKFESGFYYVSSEKSDPRAHRDLDQGPWNIQFDLRLEKTFLFKKTTFAVFAEIKNLFDRKNILAYDNTISGGNVWESDQNPAGTKNRPMYIDGSLFYDIPREIFFGFRFTF